MLTEIDRFDPTGSYVFAIGDVHGNLDALGDLLSKIYSYPKASNDKIVMIGNLVGKHKKSRGVLNLVRKLSTENKNFIVLRGPNDWCLLQGQRTFLRKEAGKSILASYYGLNEEGGYFDLPSFMKDRLWLRALPATYSTKDLLFVPSGVDPKKKLWDQYKAVVTFIRDGFHGSSKVFPKKIVHGNKACNEVVVKENRINLDSSLNNSISCVVFDEATGEVVETLVSNT